MITPMEEQNTVEQAAEAKKSIMVPVVASFALLLVSLVINYYAGTYATSRASNWVTDVILNNIPVFDVDWFFVYGAVAFWIFIIGLCVVKPHRIPFTVKSISLFILVRSVFVSLTHIGPFPTQITLDVSNLLSKFTFGGDLFFSGHTGLPFLMALVFWDNRPLRIFFILCSVAFGIVVLLGHLHYSIDVLGAFFITYSIYRLCELFFKKDKALFVMP